jgi:hypothetical protein
MHCGLPGTQQTHWEQEMAERPYLKCHTAHGEGVVEISCLPFAQQCPWRLVNNHTRTVGCATDSIEAFTFAILDTSL